MFQANITKSRLSGKFVYLQNEVLAKCNNPICTIYLGLDVNAPAVEAKVYEHDNGSGGRAYCPQLFEAPPAGSLLKLPLLLGDSIHYSITEEGNLRLQSVKRIGTESAQPPSEAPKAYDALINVGFEDIAQWEVDADGNIQHTGDHPETWISIARDFSQALYAFCVDGCPKYIGKTAATLRARFNGYRSPGDTTATNKRCNEAIKDCIRQGKAVRILVLPNRIPLKWGPYTINVAAGLEDALIDELQPEWNA